MPAELPTHLLAEGEVWARSLIGNFGLFRKGQNPSSVQTTVPQGSLLLFGGAQEDKEPGEGGISICLRLGPTEPPALSLSKGGRMTSVLAGGCQGRVLSGRSLLSLSQMLWEERDPFDRRTTIEFEFYLYVLSRATNSNRVDP